MIDIWCWECGMKLVYDWKSETYHCTCCGARVTLGGSYEEDEDDDLW